MEQAAAEAGVEVSAEKTPSSPAPMAASQPSSGVKAFTQEAASVPVLETGFVLKSMPEAAKPMEQTSSTQPKPQKASPAAPKPVSEDAMPHVGTLPAQRKARQAPSYENLTANRPRQPYAMSPTRENAIENVGPASPLPGFTPTTSPEKSRFADRYTPKSSPSGSQPASPSSSPRSPAGSAPSSSARRPHMQQHANTSRDVRSAYEPRTPEHSPRRGSYHGYSSPRQHQQQHSDERRPQSSRDDRSSMSRQQSHRLQQPGTTFGDDMISTTGRISAREQQRGSRRGSRHEAVAEESEEGETEEEEEEQDEEEEREDDATRFRIRDRVKRFFS